MFQKLALTLLGLLSASFTLQAQPQVVNGSFGTPSLGSCPNFQFSPLGTSWTFDGGGITTGGCGQQYNAPQLPAGADQAAFIQGASKTLSTTISQTVSGFVAGHNYAITFYAAGRADGAGCTDNCSEMNFSVLAGSADVLDVTSPPTNEFQQYTTDTFTASGSETISFTGTAPTGTDQTSFFTLVAIRDLSTSTSPPPPAGPQIANGSFGTPSVGACPNYQINPSGASWTFSSAGITTGGCGQLYDAPKLPSGADQAAFIQAGAIPGSNNVPGNTTTTLSQSVSGFTGDNYVITFYAAGRPQAGGCIDNCGELDFSVLIGGTDVLDVKNPPTDSFMQYTTNPFTATGTVTISFTGSSTAGDDETSFITGVAIQDLSAAPQISSNGILNGASFQPGIAAGSWFTIWGTNLSSVSDNWNNAIVDGQLPVTLDGVSVMVGDQPAYIDYVSSTQINAIAPNGVAGNLPVTVSNANGTSQAAMAKVQAVQPAFFQWGTYAVATRQDFTYAVKNGVIAGLTTTPPAPGDVIILWGTGFGPTSPAAPSGAETPSSPTYNTASPVSVMIGGQTAKVYGAALTPGYAGLYQVAIQIPDSLDDGDYAVVATIAGVQSPSTTMITVQH